MLPVVLLLVLLQTPPVFAAEGEVATAAPVNVSPPISAVELDRAIAETIQESKYAWRLPRERSGNSSDQGIIAKFLDKVVRTVRGWFRDALEWIGNILKKLFSRDRTDPARDGFEWVTGLHLLLYVLIAVLVAALVLFLLRWRARRRLVAPIATEAIQVMPDIGDESTAADQLPEDSWIALGRELLGRGELRLALRAFYLASLAHLASRNFISLARFKSNRDYGRELRRRAHSLPELAATFDENVSVFERIWYGMHEVNAETVERFASNLERFKRTA